jgi:hypothetical protein
VLANLKKKLLQLQQRQNAGVGGSNPENKPPTSAFIIDHQSSLYNFISSSMAARKTTLSMALASTTSKKQAKINGKDLKYKKIKNNK